MNKNAIKNRQPRHLSQAFSLIELLVVIAIIALLVGILLPSLDQFRKQGYRTKTIAAIAVLSNGALQYKDDTKYYPGQRYTSLLNGTSSGTPNRTHTGSQMLAACLLDGINASGSSMAHTTITEDYIPYKLGETLLTDSSNAYALSDHWKSDEEWPILYYPSRIGNNGKIGNAATSGNAFMIADNSAYGNGAATLTLFQEAIYDQRFGTAASWNDRSAYNADSFILVGAGVDREYFTNADVMNFKK